MPSSTLEQLLAKKRQIKHAMQELTGKAKRLPGFGKEARHQADGSGVDRGGLELSYHPRHRHKGYSGAATYWWE
ncbi:MAG: hypothetical protein KF711_03880 [Nitrospira sp.]|nr:hypothetical protein [Nitrospira sp.]